MLNHRRTVLGLGVHRRISAAVLAGALAASWSLAASAQTAAPGTPPPAGPTATTTTAAPPPAAASPTAPPAGTAQAPAAPPSAADLAAAKKHYAEGEKRFKAGDMAGALPEFKAANDVKATPQAERFIGLCEDALGHYAAASEWFDKFLAHVPDKMGAQADEVRKRSAEIHAMPGKVHVVTNPPGASVLIDDKPQPGPTPFDVDLAPGPHVLKFTEPGRLPADKTVDVTFASAPAVTVDLEPEPPPPPPPPAPVAATPPPPPPPPAPPPEPRSKVPAFVTGGLAVAAAGVGVVFGVLALNDKSKFDKTPTTQTADDGDTHSLIADMAFGIAITFGVTSAVLFLTKDEPPPANASADPPKKSAITITPTPFVGPHSGGVGFVAQF